MSALESVRNRFSPRLSLLLPVLLAASPVPAQTPRFEGASQVVAVEVPVNVVDREGQPVRGLTAADFEIFDGNEPQTITGFETIDLKVLQSGPDPAPAAGEPAFGRPPALPVPLRPVVLQPHLDPQGPAGGAGYRAPGAASGRPRGGRHLLARDRAQAAGDFHPRPSAAGAGHRHPGLSRDPRRAPGSSALPDRGAGRGDHRHRLGVERGYRPAGAAGPGRPRVPADARLRRRAQRAGLRGGTCLRLLPLAGRDGADAQRRQGPQARHPLLRGLRRPADARQRAAEPGGRGGHAEHPRRPPLDERQRPAIRQHRLARGPEAHARAVPPRRLRDSGGRHRRPAGRRRRARAAERPGGVVLHRQRDRRRAVQGRQQPAPAPGTGARAHQRDLSADLRALGPQARRRVPPAAGEGEAAPGRPALPPRRLLRAASVQGPRSPREDPPRLRQHRQRRGEARRRAATCWPLPSAPARRSPTCR